MSINLYPDIVHEADLSPEFGTEIDEICTEIYKACKGFGTDEERLIKAMAKDPETRTKVSLRYKESRGKDLKDLMKKECSGKLGKALQLLAVPPDVAEAKLIKDATAGLGTKEKHLYPIICGRSNADIDVLKKTYYKKYDKDLGSLLSSELSGDFEKLLFMSLQGAEEDYDPDYHTEHKAKDDAEVFYEAGQGRWGTDEKTLFKALCFSPPQHLKAVNSAYADKYGYTLFKAFEKDLRGDAEDAVLYTLGMKLKPYETAAKMIKEACAGAGTDEQLLTACIVRYQNILPHVMVAHIELFGKSVQDRVRDEARGDYCKLLLEVLNNVIPDGA